MKLATIRTMAGTRAVRVDGDVTVELGDSDLVEVLSRPDWRRYAAAADGVRHDAADIDYAPLVVRPEKVLCVGLNYRTHILEMGRELPRYPTLFGKYARTLVGAYDDIVLPAVSEAVDWEAELAVVVGSFVRDADRRAAANAIAGYTVCNDVSVRDWQYRTPQWLQGKAFEETTPVGPWLVVTDEADGAFAPPGYDIGCAVDDEVMQQSNTEDLVHDPADLISYISTIITLAPGDVIVTGTPGGVGHARDPRRYLTDGAVLTTTVEGIGQCRNTCRQQRR